MNQDQTHHRENNYVEKITRIHDRVTENSLAIAVIDTKLDARDNQDRECWEQVDKRIDKFEQRFIRHMTLTEARFNRTDDHVKAIIDRLGRYEVRLVAIGGGLGAIGVAFLANFDKIAGGIKTIVGLFG